MYLNQFNKHWKKDFFYDISFKRDYFDDLLYRIKNKFILNIIWIRRVWKTTLMKQLIDDLIVNNNVNRKNIFFYSFDELWDIKEIIDYNHSKGIFTGAVSNGSLVKEKINKIKNLDLCLW